MINDLISIANYLDRSGLIREAEYLDDIIRKISGLGDEALNDDTTELLREEDLADIIRAEQAWRYAPDEELDDPDSYVNSIDIDMDLLRDTNIMPTQVLDDYDLKGMSIVSDPSLDDSLSGGRVGNLSGDALEVLMRMSSLLMSVSDKNDDDMLSVEEVGESLYSFLYEALAKANSDLPPEAIEEMANDEILSLSDSDEPLDALIDSVDGFGITDEEEE